MASNLTGRSACDGGLCSAVLPCFWSPCTGTSPDTHTHTHTWYGGQTGQLTSAAWLTCVGGPSHQDSPGHTHRTGQEGQDRTGQDRTGRLADSPQVHAHHPHPQVHTHSSNALTGAGSGGSDGVSVKLSTSLLQPEGERCVVMCHKMVESAILLTPLGRKLEVYHCVRVGHVPILRVTRFYRLGTGP